MTIPLAPLPPDELRSTMNEGVLCWTQIEAWQLRVFEYLQDLLPGPRAHSGSLTRALRDPDTERALCERLPEIFHSVSNGLARQAARA